MLREVGFTKIAEWRFGTDAADILRSVAVQEQKMGNNSLFEHFKKNYIEIIDDVQILMDKVGFSSETHIVAKRHAC